MESTKEILIKLTKQHKGSVNIPDIKLKNILGIPEEKSISRGHLVDLIKDKVADENSIIDQAETQTIDEDTGKWIETGQPQQKIRDRIREKLIGPLEKSGQIK